MSREAAPGAAPRRPAPGDPAPGKSVPRESAPGGSTATRAATRPASRASAGSKAQADGGRAGGPHKAAAPPRRTANCGPRVARRCGGCSKRAWASSRNGASRGCGSTTSSGGPGPRTAPSTCTSRTRMTCSRPCCGTRCTIWEGITGTFPLVTRDEAGRAALRQWVTSFCETYAAHAAVIGILSQAELVGEEVWGDGMQVLFKLAEAMTRGMTASAPARSPDGQGGPDRGQHAGTHRVRPPDDARTGELPAQRRDQAAQGGKWWTGSPPSSSPPSTPP